VVSSRDDIRLFTSSELTTIVCSVELGSFAFLLNQSSLISVSLMSWIKEMAGGEAMPPYVETDSPSNPKVKDPSIPNRMVSTKPANRPFLAYVLIPNFTFQMQTQIN
jgi:hypothetical protein